MNIKHIGNHGNMQVEVTGIDTVTRAVLADAYLRRDWRREAEATVYTGTEVEYGRYTALLEVAEGTVRLRGGAA